MLKDVFILLLFPFAWFGRKGAGSDKTAFHIFEHVGVFSVNPGRKRKAIGLFVNSHVAHWKTYQAENGGAASDGSLACQAFILQSDECI